MSAARAPIRGRPAVVRRWCVRLPSRPPFMVICVQGATAAEMRHQWPRARVEPCDGA